MTSSKFKSEITGEPWQIEVSGATHTKPYHFLHLISHLKNSNLCYDVIMTSSKFKSEITREP